MLWSVKASGPHVDSSADPFQDLRNHGDSPHHPVHDYSAMADDIEEFIREHDLKDVALIGHSMSA